MGLTLKQVVPWGRSLADYRQMFALTDKDLETSILDCAGGPSSFNAEATAQGTSVISCDPIYQFSVEEIQQRIQDTYPQIIAALEDNGDHFVWDQFSSPHHLGEVRLATMDCFLEDFPQGRAQGRYQTQMLPELPFETSQFNLALCGHLLFSYSQPLDLEFHLNAIRELARVAQEVRIFPIVTNFAGDISPHLSPILEQLPQAGYHLTVETVPYEFQRGGNEMLRVFPPNHYQSPP
ncbi:SAM-dependent methyltransferase [Sodalinema gerasimenkoae]|uniref:SAM-dependent methyltransferase n=1 Tax=Sodalinema gerasimenkoae TaxID=2862348 RepID=UPI00135BE60F|nr:SAM-dependent methyltransferase [Sodalinema gerasimenkoae]